MYRYKPMRSIQPDVTYLDEGAICIWCKEDIDIDYLLEKGPFGTDDNETHIIKCPHCGLEIAITQMVVLYRYMTKAG